MTCETETVSTTDLHVEIDVPKDEGFEYKPSQAFGDFLLNIVQEQIKRDVEDSYLEWIQGKMLDTISEYKSTHTGKFPQRIYITQQQYRVLRTDPTPGRFVRDSVGNAVFQGVQVIPLANQPAPFTVD